MIHAQQSNALLGTQVLVFTCFKKQKKNSLVGQFHLSPKHFNFQLHPEQRLHLVFIIRPIHWWINTHRFRLRFGVGSLLSEIIIPIVLRKYGGGGGSHTNNTTIPTLQLLPTYLQRNKDFGNIYVASLAKEIRKEFKVPKLTGNSTLLHHHCCKFLISWWAIDFRTMESQHFEQFPVLQHFSRILL